MKTTRAMSPFETSASRFPRLPKPQPVLSPWSSAPQRILGSPSSPTDSCSAEETLIAPAHTTFHASNEFVVKVGNAAAVSFLLNGKEVAPQGNESEVKTLTFDSSGLKSAP